MPLVGIVNIAKQTSLTIYRLKRLGAPMKSDLKDQANNWCEICGDLVTSSEYIYGHKKCYNTPFLHGQKRIECAVCGQVITPFGPDYTVSLGKKIMHSCCIETDRSNKLRECTECLGPITPYNPAHFFDTNTHAGCLEFTIKEDKDEKKTRYENF